MSYKPTKTVSISKLISATNICNLLTEDDISAIGKRVMEGYEQDISSRRDWERRQAVANKLALQVMEERTEPWPNAANVKFPLVTVASMQFQARAYAELLSGTDLVKVRVIGKDQDGQKKERAERIAAHMNWQCLEQDSSWEEDHDKLFLVTAIAGCAFVMNGYEPGPGKVMARLVLPRHFVVNYWTRSVDDSQRYTYTHYLNANNIRQREIDGRYREIPSDASDVRAEYGNTDNPPRPEATASDDEIQAAKDERQGITKPQTDEVTPWFTGEQYCWLDLDGDGYEEPYIVTVDIGSSMVRRIVARYLPGDVKFLSGKKLSEFSTGEDYNIPEGEEIYKITPVKVFTKYAFVPSPDGGFYDLGLGSLEGPINATVNTLINQMLDQGTMATLGGGFLGRAFKGRGGPISFAPNQWHPLDAAGDDIRKSILPLPIREPSTVLFQLLGLLIQYAERIVSANDIQLGESDLHNQKAETTRILNENGQRVYNSIRKRFWRALRDEFRVRFELNARFLSVDSDFEDLTTGVSGLVQPDDYLHSSLLVRPAADPHVVSDAQAERQAMTLLQLANSQPGYNRYKVNLRYLKAIRLPNIEEVYPPPVDPKTGQPLPDYPMPPNPKMLEANRKMQETQLKVAEFQAEQRQAQVDALMEIRESMARVDKLKAETAKLLAEAKNEKTKPIIEMIYAQIESEGKRQDRLMKYVEMIDKRMEGTSGRDGDNRGDAGMDGAQNESAVQALSSLARANGQGAPGGLGGSPL